MLTVGSLFAGIGGFDLGLERTGGFQIKWQVEIDEYCRRVLAKHWPHVQRYGDIREVTDAEPVDVLCGGFPCQDISNAGNRAGIDGERSGLWSEYVRIIRLVRPRYVIVENVAALLGRGMGRVLGDLSESGYDAEWDVISAAAVGAPHLRERVWIIAYPESDLRRASRHDRPVAFNGSGSLLADSENDRQPRRRIARSGRNGSQDGGQVGYAEREQNHHVGADCERGRVALEPYRETSLGNDGQANPNSLDGSGWWAVEPELGRVAHGIPDRVHRLKGLGNAIVPQIATWLGNQILNYERDSPASGSAGRLELTQGVLDLPHQSRLVTTELVSER